MTDTNRKLAVIALLVTVATQIFYITVVSNDGPDTVLRPITWFTELGAFVLLAIVGLVQAAREPIAPFAWAAIAVGSLFNAVQASMGLAMFGPAMEASETSPQIFATVIAGAFFFYFLAKVLYGFAAIGFARNLLTQGNGVHKAVAVLAGLSGLAAIGLNGLAMVVGRDWTFAAGACGTAATTLLAACVLLSSPGQHRANR